MSSAELQATLTRLAEALDRISEVPSSSAFPFTLQQLLAVLVKHKGIFLHLNPGSTPMLRIGNELVPVGEHVAGSDDCRYLISTVLNSEQRRLLAGGHELEFTYSDGSDGFRFHVFQEKGNPSASIRRIRTDIASLADLGLAGGRVELFLNQSQGLMLLAGKPRCGKINTFASIVSHISQSRRVRVVTIEPEIKFWHNNALGTVIQREIGSDTVSFGQAVRQARNQDADVLAIGSIADAETAEVAIKAAGGGYLVIGVVDAVNGTQALQSILTNVGDSRVRELLARVLHLVVCQHLVPRADGRGQIPAHEVLEAIPGVRSLVASGQLQGLDELMRQEGMQTLPRHLSRLVEAGRVKLEEAGKLVDPAHLEINPAAPAPSLADDDSPLFSWL